MLTFTRHISFNLQNTCTYNLNKMRMKSGTLKILQRKNVREENEIRANSLTYIGFLPKSIAIASTMTAGTKWKKNFCT